MGHDVCHIDEKNKRCARFFISYALKSFIFYGLNKEGCDEPKLRTGDTYFFVGIDSK